MYTEVGKFIAKPGIAKLLFLCVLMFFGWRIFVGLTVFFAPTHTEITQPAIQTKRKLPTLGIKTPFFGEYVPALTDAQFKRSTLNLQVVGILFAKPEKDSQVIIRTASGIDKIYHLGDELPGGVIIKRITPAGILVGQNGEIERLDLLTNPLIFSPPLTAPLLRNQPHDF